MPILDVTALTACLPQSIWIHGPEPALEQKVVKFIHQILCEKGTGCGACSSCRSWDGDHHPDLLSFSDKGKPMDMAFARSSRGDVELAPVVAPRRVLWVWKADELNVSVANSLLKLTEEPPESVTVILSGETRRLLPTLQSRVWSFSLPEEKIQPRNLPCREEDWLQILAWAGEKNVDWPALLKGWELSALDQGNELLASTLSQLAVQGVQAHLSPNQWADLSFLMLKEDYPCEYLFDHLRQTPIFRSHCYRRQPS